MAPLSSATGWGQSSPIRLVFWVELDPRPIAVGSGGPKA
jgi:hypothetical protein